MTKKYDGLFAFSIRIHDHRHGDLDKTLILQGKGFGAAPLYGTCVHVSKRAIQVLAHRPMDDAAFRLNAAAVDQRDPKYCLAARAGLGRADFQEPRLSRNLALVEGMWDIGKRHGVSLAIVAIAWVQRQAAKRPSTKT